MKKILSLSILCTVLILSLLACGGSSTANSTNDSDMNSSPANPSNSPKTNLLAGTVEVTLPDDEIVHIPIEKCGGNNTMLDIQEYTKTAPGNNPYVGILITYPKGEGETNEGQFHITYGKEPSGTTWGNGTDTARIWRNGDQSGHISNIVLDNRTFSVRWVCP